METLFESIAELIAKLIAEFSTVNQQKGMPFFPPTEIKT